MGGDRPAAGPGDDGMNDALRALAEPRRRAILQLVAHCELSAGEIAGCFDVTRTAVSQHLTVLKKAGLLAERKQATRRLYRARPEGLAGLREFLDQMWASSLEVARDLVEADRGAVGGAQARPQADQDDRGAGMKAVLVYESADDVAASAPPHFAAHRARWKEFADRGELLMIGPFANAQDDGAMGIFTTRAAAEEFVRGDPFVQHGVVRHWTIREWNEALIPDKPASAPPGPQAMPPGADRNEGTGHTRA